MSQLLLEVPPWANTASATAEGAVFDYKIWCDGSKEDDKCHFTVPTYAFRVIAIKHGWFHIS